MSSDSQPFDAPLVLPPSHLPFFATVPILLQFLHSTSYRLDTPPRIPNLRSYPMFEH